MPLGAIISHSAISLDGSHGRNDESTEGRHRRTLISLRRHRERRSSITRAFATRFRDEAAVREYSRAADECAPQRTRVCVRADLVGRVITIRSVYKGMHQGGNKSGAHRESICFHLHGRAAREGPTADVDGEGRHPESGGFFRAERIARSRELFMEWLLKSYGRGCPVFAKHARHRRLILSRRGKRQAAAPSPSPPPPIGSAPRSGALVVFLGRNNTGRTMSS